MTAESGRLLRPGRALIGCRLWIGHLRLEAWRLKDADKQIFEPKSKSGSNQTYISATALVFIPRKNILANETQTTTSACSQDLAMASHLTYAKRTCFINSHRSNALLRTQ